MYNKSQKSSYASRAVSNWYLEYQCITNGTNSLRTTDLNNFEIIWKHKQVNPEPYCAWLFKCSVVPLQVKFGLFASFNEQTNPIFTGL